MMDDSSVVDVDDDEGKIVTKFLLNTCRLGQPTEHDLQAAKWHYLMVTDVTVPRRFISLITGSSAEFYIRPMLPCFGDVDIMCHKSDMLAIPEGYAPPTELPAEFQSRVSVCEIIDSEYPGYVYLMLSYLLTEDSDATKYSSIRYDRRTHVSHRLFNVGNEPDTIFQFHGPAKTGHDTMADLSVDLVLCVRCLSWPSQAAGWPTRHRNYDWPDSATVDLVVNNGCDFVHVAHCLCRQDEWMSECQYRMSFSRAEIVLLNSWMPVQQIVYHMLRVFIKTERLTNITDSTGRKIISSYQFKTLMMWACEQKPQSWWIDGMNFVEICVTLLRTLADCMKNTVCRHYFVNNCNIIYYTEHLEIIASRLSSITESWLSTWFVNNYLLKCAQLCPDRVSRLFDDVSTSMKLQNAVSAVVDCRRNSALNDLRKFYFSTEYCVPANVSDISLTLPSCCCWISELVKIDLCLCDYFTAVAFLHVANRIAKHSFSEELLDVLATLVGQFVGKRRYCHQLSSELSLSQAVILMKVVANTSRSTVQQIEFELSKMYLHRALRCKDSDSDSIYCLANVYLAVLYCTLGKYETAIDHCALVSC